MDKINRIKNCINNYKIAVLIPTYNNCSTIKKVINDVQKYIQNIIVINDGSTDSTIEILQSIRGIELISFQRNCGKGCALKAGIKRAYELNYSHVITFDSDGQHIAVDIPQLIEKIYEEPDVLWVGNRTLPYDKGYAPPRRSSFGRKFGRFWYKFNTGIALNDTQSGFRAYPLSSIISISCKGERYEYEQEILIKAAWNDIPVKEVPIRLYYPSKKNSISHFRPIRDFLRISRINSKAAMTRIFLPKELIKSPGSTLKEKIITLIKYEIRANTTPKKAAFSLSTGVFLGIFPIHLFQVVTLLGLSFILKLNRPLGYLGVSISSPPLMPLIFIVTVGIGKLVLLIDFLPQASYAGLGTAAQYGIEFIVGSIVLAPIAASTTFLISFPIFKQLAKIKLQKKQRALNDI